MTNTCTACDYPVHACALFCRGCGNMTTAVQAAPKPVHPSAVTRQANKQWAKRMAAYKRWKEAMKCHNVA